ncbi:Hypothetical_protein [Hexamita inflata]|uniref:Hypothetical_protein n=1 Tax=Hexamita inflata TaxID=28002 RepID=A0AA86NEH4_9EUKA|nr:Hypothetical protein HINF_LOCUS5456 [Hexamita inflata]
MRMVKFRTVYKKCCSFVTINVTLKHHNVQNLYGYFRWDTKKQIDKNINNIFQDIAGNLELYLFVYKLFAPHSLMILINIISSSPLFLTLQQAQLLPTNVQQVAQTSICTNQIFRDQPINFCIKALYLESKDQSSDIVHTTAGALFHTLYTERATNIRINLTYSMMNLPSFALFGLTNSISMLNSNCSVKIPQSLAQGALVCFKCDINATASDFAFIASGQNVSSLILSSNTLIAIDQSLVQYRLFGVNVGGLAISASWIQFLLTNCNISGFFRESNISASVITFVLNTITIQIGNVRICANTNKFGSGESFLIIIGVFIESCDLCANSFYTYGLCVDEMEYSENVNHTLVCKYPFVFDGMNCQCQVGLVINESSCVNILNAVNQLLQVQEETDASVAKIRERLDTNENDSIHLKMSQDIIELQILDLYDLNNATLSYIKDDSSQLQDNIRSNFTTLEANIELNASILDWRIYNNITSLHDRIHILDNSMIEIHQSVTSMNQTIQYQQISENLLGENIISLNQSLLATNQFIQLQQDLIQTNNIQFNQNLTDLQQALLVSNQHILSQQMQINLLNLNIQCLSNIDALNISRQCYIKYSLDETMQCSQKIYVTNFDLSIATYIVNSNNLTNGYVFSAYIQDAFINIQDYVYNSIINPLFQNQSIFTNIKILIGAQSVNNGSLLTPSNAVTVNQMNIISQFGSQLTVNGAKFNILMQYSISTNITNFLVNLSFKMTNSNITLISSISGSINITGYQVLGTYQSTQTVAMLGLYVSLATLYINYINFQPEVYNVGNYSSCLFSEAISGIFVFNQISIILGNSSNYQLSVSIITNSFQYYTFGGLVCSTKSGSIDIIQFISDAYQLYNTNYICYSGFLVGNINSITINISVYNACVYYNMVSTSQNISYFGLVGYNSGNLLLQKALISLNVSGIFQTFGIVGFSQNSKIFDIQISTLIGQKSSYSSSAIIGLNNLKTSIQNSTIKNSQFVGQRAGAFIDISFGNSSIINSNLIQCTFNCSIHAGGYIGELLAHSAIINSTVNQSNISSTSHAGGFIAMHNALYNTTVNDSVITQTTVYGSNVAGGYIGIVVNSYSSTDNLTINLTAISGLRSVGGFFGNTTSSSLYLQRSNISYVRITGQDFGVIVGDSSNCTFKFSASSSIMNYLNGFQTECVNFDTQYSSGCIP